MASTTEKRRAASTKPGGSTAPPAATAGPAPARTRKDTRIQAGPVTLYAQLASILRDRVMNGLWKPGDEIPTLAQLVEEFSVARVTVRQAVQMLVQEGLLSSHRGRGTFVTAGAVRSGAPLYSSTGSIDGDETNYTIKVLSREEVDSLPPYFSGPGAGAGKYMRVRKVDSGNGAPSCLADNFVASSLYRTFPAGSDGTVKLSRLVRDHARPRLASGHERVAVGAATYEEADHLQTSIGSPVARVERVLLMPGAKVAYFGRVIYRGDRFGIERSISDLLYARDGQ